MLNFQQKGEKMKNFLTKIKKCPIFWGIDDGDIEKMLTCMGAKVMTLDKKYTVFTEGSPAKYIGVVLSGEVQVVRNDYWGNRSIVENNGEGQTFCEAFACAGEQNLPVSVVASVPSEVMLLNSDHILHTCSNNCAFHRQLIFNLMQSLAHKNIGYHQRIEVTSKRTTREKIMAYLTLTAKKENSNVFTIPFDRQELADYLEVERSGLSAELSKLVSDGIIKTQKSKFEIL